MEEQKEKDFSYKNLTCCTVVIYWKDINKEKNINESHNYELYIQEDKEPHLIYRGKKTEFEVINLKPKKTYIFKLKIIKENKYIYKKTISVITCEAPHAIISEHSDKIANGENINIIDNITENQKNIINNCSKLIFEEKDDNIIKGNFNEIEIKIANTMENNTSVNYISFEIKSDFEKIFRQFIKEYENNILIPSHFIIKKLPTILILNLIEKGTVILTGKRMGGLIAASLAFDLFYIEKEKKMNLNFTNPFKNIENNGIGVVTFGSPIFLQALYAGIQIKEFTPHFIHIKEEFDYIPEIIDSMNINSKFLNELMTIIQKMDYDENEIKFVKNILRKKNKVLDNNGNNYQKIPFGFYYKLETKNLSLIRINEKNFKNFYYSLSSENIDSIPNKSQYSRLSLKSIAKFDKLFLEFLEKKEGTQIEYAKILRRIKESDSKLNTIKGIIKFKLDKNDHNAITPDIINKITLIPESQEILDREKRKQYIIKESDIYYDNDHDITAYIDDLNENINQVIISNNFGGTMKVKNIINMMGSGVTSKMLINTIEKLFMIPFFKLFEIFYISLDEKKKYNELKEKNFGINFEDLKILKLFENQINILNNLLILSRPDLLGKFENEFIEQYIKKSLNENQINSFKKKLELYYKQALELQKQEKINCLDSQRDSVAKRIPFPQNIIKNGGIKKLFMTKNSYFENYKVDNQYIKQFYIENIIKTVLQYIEKSIESVKKNEPYKEFLNKKIGEFYDEQIKPNIYFYLILILSSIEGGDQIKFNHIIDASKISSYFFYSLIWICPYGETRTKYEKDFKFIFNKVAIERLNMRNVFCKTKMKEIMGPNFSLYGNEQKISSESKKQEKNLNPDRVIIERNKTYDFSKYSELGIFGKKYYESFLNLLNYSNDFLEDVEIAIYDNFKKGNKFGDINEHIARDMINNLIIDEESRKGFNALLDQSFLLGKLRTNVVSI